MSRKLPQFIEWFKKSKKVPNLSKFAETTMPKGRGKKGGACSRKRKPSLPTKKSIENPSWSSTIPTILTAVVPPEVSESNSTLHSIQPQVETNSSSLFLPPFYSQHHISNFQNNWVPPMSPLYLSISTVYPGSPW